MDTIGDFITILRNASHARLSIARAQYSKVRVGIAKILLEQGFISAYKESIDNNGHKCLDISLKYESHSVSQKTPVLVGIKRASTPGCRVYSAYDAIPKVLGGLGVSILTTSKGIMSDKDARKQKIGGEIICTVW